MLTSELMAKVRRIELRTRRLANDSFAGEYHSVFKGRGIEFDEVRPYQPGDEVRTIDWNVTARMNQPYVKRYVEARELTVMLVVDASASGNFGSADRFKRELAAEIAAVLAIAATNNNDKVGLAMFTDSVELFIPPRKGRSHVLRIVREVLAFQPRGKRTDIGHALDTVNRLVKRRGIVFLISDFLAEPEEYDQALFLANRRHDAIAIDLHDPLETYIGPIGMMAMEDAETGEIVWVDTRDPHWRANFERVSQARTAAKVNAFRRAGVDRIAVNTHEDYVEALTRFFHKREQRQQVRH
jgi:uncharacterized protein (DUF58 family)